MFSLFFIRRPIFAAVVSIVIVILGLVAMTSLPIARYPDIAPPTINVSAIYPGADARTVADTVAATIEKEVNGVEGMIYMSSVSANDGSMNLTVTFEPGTDLDTANVLVQNRVSKAEARLPEEVRRQGVGVKKKSTDTVMFIGLTVKGGDYPDPAAFLSNYANQRVRDEIARVDGVGDVMVYGVGEFSMRIWLNPNKLKARNLVAGDVINAIREQNIQVAAGKIGAAPVPKGTDYEYVVTTKGRLVEAKEFGRIVIKTGSDGRVIRVSDVARVELGSDVYNFSAQLNGEPAATIAIYQIPGSNLITVAEGVKDKLEELSASFPAGMKYTVVYDATDVIWASIKEVVVTLLATLVLVVLTVYVFLQNFRATLIPAITIPVSLIGTFAVLQMLGYSINQLTLFGLVLVIGIVVDDAIVVVENTFRHLADGLSGKEAASKAMMEVSGPVIATTLVLLAVFVPTTFMGGITGTLFKQFAVTISVATVFSSINALTLSPALCGILLKPGQKEPRGFFKWFNTSLEASTNGYLKIVRTAIRFSFVGLILFIGLTALSMVGLQRLPTGFVPQEDEGYCMISAQLPDGASNERTNAFFEKVGEALGEIDGVKDYLTISGISILDGAVSSNAGFVVITFDHWDERKTPELSQASLLRQINAKLQAMPEAQGFAFAMPSLPGIGMSGGFTFLLQDRGGVGLEQLQAVGQEIIADGNAQQGLEGLNTTFRATVPQIYLDIDREQVKRTGTNMRDVFDTLQTFLGSSYVNDFTYFGQVYKVTAQAEGEFRDRKNDIARLELRGNGGKMIPLSAIAEVEDTLGPQSITRFNLYPAVKILGNAAPGFSSGGALDIMEDMAEKKLPSSMGYNWSELSYQEKQAAGGTSVIFLFAIVMVYLVLAAQYESWSIPIAVCLSVPTALLGAVIGIMARGMDNNVYTQIGIVLLIGLSTKSAILIVEFAKVQRESGMSIFDAAVSATKLRFRAVLMTAFSFILGVIPLLVASGAGSASRQVLGTAVFAGMLVATCISLALVPMIYYMIQKTAEGAWGKKDA